MNCKPKLFRLLFIIYLVGGYSSYGQLIAPRVSVTVTVVDEQGMPVEGAEVQGLFKGMGAGGVDDIILKRLTDSEGVTQLSRRTRLWVSLTVRREGYYHSNQELKTVEWDRKSKKNIYYSDQAVTLVLREVKNPVAMYAYRLDTQLQDTAKAKGFDLIKNDWVVPWGKGEIADVLFSITGFYNDKFNYDSTLLLELPNKGDGIATFEVNEQSHFKSPYEAYGEGYASSKKWRKSRHPNPDNPKKHTITDDAKHDANYIIRIRTVLDENGEVVSALYGKIYGDFSFGGATEEASYLQSGFIYLNPTPNDRNLECDPKQNLLKGVKSWNQPKDP